MKKLILILTILLSLALVACMRTSIENAEKLADREKYDKAIKMYEALVEEDDMNFDAWYGLLDTYMDDDNYEDAVDVLEDFGELILDNFDYDDDDMNDAYEEFLEYAEEINEEEELEDWYDDVIDGISEMIDDATPEEEKASTKEETTIEETDSYNEVVLNDQLVGISLPSEFYTRWVRDGSLMKESLENQGYEVILEYADDDIMVQRASVEGMIDAGCKVLMIAPVDPYAFDSILEEAKNLGIKVISYDRLIYDTANVDYYITFDMYNTGKLQADYIIEALGLELGSGPFSMEVFGGSPDDFNAYFYYNGAMDALKPYINNGQLIVNSGQVEMEDVATQGWSPEVSESRMDSILSEFYQDSRLDVVLSPNDTIAQGIVAALQTYGYGPKDNLFPILTGQDCELTNIKMIINEEQSMSVLKDTRTLADQSAQMAVEILENQEVSINDTTTFDNGVKLIPSFLCQGVIVDQYNYQELLINSGYYTEDQLQ